MKKIYFNTPRFFFKFKIGIMMMLLAVDKEVGIKRHPKIISNNN